MAEEKRRSGQIIDDKKKGHKIWLVLSESTGKEGVGFKHKCGTEIMGVNVTHPIWDGPFRIGSAKLVDICQNRKLQGQGVKA